MIILKLNKMKKNDFTKKKRLYENSTNLIIQKKKRLYKTQRKIFIFGIKNPNTRLIITYFPYTHSNSFFCFMKKIKSNVAALICTAKKEHEKEENPKEAILLLLFSNWLSPCSCSLRIPNLLCSELSNLLAQS